MSQVSIPQLPRTPSMSRGASSTPQPNGIIPKSQTPAAIDGATARNQWDRQNSLTSNYTQRIKTNLQTALVVPVIQVPTSTLPPRSARRGQTAVNYAEDDDDEFDGKGGRDKDGGAAQQTLIPEEIDRPVELSGKPVSILPPLIRTSAQRDGAADLPRLIVPIYLELNLGDRKVRDPILWNLYEGEMTLEKFARQECMELELDPKKYLDEIVTTMRNTLSEWGPIAAFPFPEPFKHPITGEENKFNTVLKVSYDLRDEHVKDQFEWNLFSNTVSPEEFARVTCVEAGMHGEHIPTMTAAIYQAILQAKKELIESMSMGTTPNDVPVDQHHTHTAWRYHVDNLGAEWGTSLEKLSREEMEKKESDRERSTRRQRRETAKVAPATPGGFFVFGAGSGGPPETPGTPGTPSAESYWKRKQKRPMRDRSPLRKIGAMGPGSSGPAVPLPDMQLLTWRCTHCNITGINVWGVQDGPEGKNSLCAVCGLLYNEDGELPDWRERLYLRGIERMDIS